MKTISELRNGECVIIAKSGQTTKEFNGIYNEQLKVVFYTIPSYYSVLGYKQD